MGRELKPVFPDEKTDKFMGGLYLAKEGYTLSEADQLSMEEYKALVQHMWNLLDGFMRMSDTTKFFQHYYEAQLVARAASDVLDELKTETDK